MRPRGSPRSAHMVSPVDDVEGELVTIDKLIRMPVTVNSNVNTYGESSKDKPYRVEVVFGKGDDQKLIRCLIDSGAQISLINSRLTDELSGKTEDREPRFPNVQTANGDVVSIKKAQQYRISIGPKDFRFTFNLLDGLAEQVILGRDWLSYHKVNIDCGQHVLSLYDLKVDLRTGKLMKGKYIVPKENKYSKVPNTSSGSGSKHVEVKRSDDCRKSGKTFNFWNKQRYQSDVRKTTTPTPKKSVNGGNTVRPVKSVGPVKSVKSVRPVKSVKTVESRTPVPLRDERVLNKSKSNYVGPKRQHSKHNVLPTIKASKPQMRTEAKVPSSRPAWEDERHNSSDYQMRFNPFKCSVPNDKVFHNNNFPLDLGRNDFWTS